MHSDLSWERLKGTDMEDLRMDGNALMNIRCRKIWQIVGL
jgi:hypothetical protein